MKKKERKFQSLEDIENSFRKSVSAKKEKKQSMKKTAFSGVPQFTDLLEEYGRLLVIPAVSLILIVLILILQAIWPGETPQAAAQTPAENTESAAPEENTGEEAAQDSGDAEAASSEEDSASAEETEEAEPDGPIPCRIPQIEQTVNDYFTARLNADADTLYRLYGRTSDTGKDALVKRLKAQASWIQSYDGIAVYTMPGMDDDSKVCIVTYKINFRRTNTNAPGIMYCYMTKQADGNWQIGENLRSDKVQYIDEKLADAEVVKMQDEVDAQLRSALNSDSTLALIYTSFLNGEIYNETAPDLNAEQEVDFLNNPADSDLVGGLVIENDGETAEGEPEAESGEAGEAAADGGEAAGNEAADEPMSSDTAAADNSGAAEGSEPAAAAPQEGAENTETSAAEAAEQSIVIG